MLCESWVVSWQISNTEKKYPFPITLYQILLTLCIETEWIGL